MSNYASLTGARSAGVFDSLFVRSPADIEPFVSVLGVASTVGPAIAALETDLATKRDVADSFSRPEIQGLLDTQAATRYTKVEADQLFRTEVDAVAALVLLRVYQ